MNDKRLLAGLLLLLFFLVSAPQVRAGGGKSTAVIVDQSGRRIAVKRPFKRIISLYGAHTENLFALGLDREIIGVSRHEAYPPGVTTKPVFSYHDDAEKFLAVRPDLVLIRPMIARGYKNLVAMLQKAGITVVSLQPKTVDEIFAYWQDLGRLTGREKEAQAMIRRFKGEVKRVGCLVATIPARHRKRVYFEAIHSKMKTLAPSSIAAFALRTAGGINIATDAKTVRGTNIAAYGKEHLLSRGADIDVFIAQTGAMNPVRVRDIFEESGFKAIKAVRQGQVYLIDEKIVARPTMRLLEGIDEIGRILYPAVFNDVSALKRIPVVNRAQFARMFVKMLNIRFKTPSYHRDIQKRSPARHLYGDFRDVDYAGESYQYIETAVYRGLFRHVDKYRFYPRAPMTRQAVAYAVFVYFDLPEAGPVVIKDVDDSHPLFNQIQAVAGLGIMKLNPGGEFQPAGTISGAALFRILSAAPRLAAGNPSRRLSGGGR